MHKCALTLPVHVFSGRMRLAVVVAVAAVVRVRPARPRPAAIKHTLVRPRVRQQPRPADPDGAQFTVARWMSKRSLLLYTCIAIILLSGRRQDVGYIPYYFPDRIKDNLLLFCEHEDKYVNYTRMFVGTFDELLAKIGDVIRGQDTNMRCSDWIARSGRDDFKELPNKSLKNKRICSKHFEEKHFANELRNKLNRNAVPMPYYKQDTTETRETDILTTAQLTTSMNRPTSTENRNQGDVKNDDSLPSHSGAWEIESSSTTRPPQDTLFVEPADIKHEEELILEDYGEPEEMTVGEISDGKGADNISCEDPFYHQIKQEPPEETPFETVYCGDSAMEIKQEFDDEADTPANSDGSIDQMWEELPPKKIKPSHRISLISASTKKKNLKRSKQNDKYLQCEICHQYLFSQSAFVKHYITNHEGDKETNPPSVPTYLVSSQGSKPPIKPPGESLSTDSSDSLENISVSLKNVPLGKRNSSKDKIVELVNFIAKDDDLDPSSIKFVILNC